MAATRLRPDNPIPSSSPTFGTPLHPALPLQSIPPPPAFRPALLTVIPVLLPPPTLRPLAFRTFTKKHNLTLNSSALQTLATFIGRHCGSGWREEGLAEKVLEEVAKTWKQSGGAVIVEDGALLKSVLKTLEGCMSGGRVTQGKNSTSRQSSFAFANADDQSKSTGDARPNLGPTYGSFGLSSLKVEEVEEEEEHSQDPRAWLKVTNAFEQPQLTYNVNKKHFEKSTTKSSLFPPPSHKTVLFRERYNLIHQRLLRNEAFQAPSFNQRTTPTLARSDSVTVQQFYRITPIANLLGRSGSSHLLLGLLVVAPTGTLALNDMTGSIALDLQHAKPLADEDACYCPGMIVLIEGVYEEEYSGAGGGGLGNISGVGGTIGGKFIGFQISGPPSEKRNVTLGIANKEGEDAALGGGFGWTDFLGLGSERAVGSKMRRLERKLLGPGAQHAGNGKMVILSEVNLDQPRTLEALRKVLNTYTSESPTEIPMTFVLMGNFTTHAVMAGGGSGGSIEYKEYFNELAAVLSECPSLLRVSTFVFVPGDNDPWASAFSAGASTAIPRQEVPEIFTSRIKRAFATARAEIPGKSGIDGEAIWTTNPARLNVFGPAHEVVVFRDDISGRLRRTAIRFGHVA
ncbi:DNA-directed DNA polymerase epsilon, subunit B, partial [Elasticomyces elasticus]